MPRWSWVLSVLGCSDPDHVPGGTADVGDTARPVDTRDTTDTSGPDTTDSGDPSAGETGDEDAEVLCPELPTGFDWCTALDAVWVPPGLVDRVVRWMNDPCAVVVPDGTRLLADWSGCADLAGTADVDGMTGDSGAYTYKWDGSEVALRLDGVGEPGATVKGSAEWTWGWGQGLLLTDSLRVTVPPGRMRMLPLVTTGGTFTCEEYRVDLWSSRKYETTVGQLRDAAGATVQVTTDLEDEFRDAPFSAARVPNASILLDRGDVAVTFTWVASSPCVTWSATDGTFGEMCVP